MDERTAGPSYVQRVDSGELSGVDAQAARVTSGRQLETVKEGSGGGSGPRDDDVECNGPSKAVQARQRDRGGLAALTNRQGLRGWV